MRKKARTALHDQFPDTRLCMGGHGTVPHKVIIHRIPSREIQKIEGRILGESCSGQNFQTFCSVPTVIVSSPKCSSTRTASIGVTVRREKALDFSGCNSRPGTGSLHPVAIEAAAEATKLSELSV
jgi:hypothetical protein